MKIDLHAHTKKTKKGEADTRNVEAKSFRDIVTSTDVGIIAITNHNLFDLEQYESFLKNVEGRIQIWPGVEFDVVCGDTKGHLLVIVSPQKSQDFSKLINCLTASCNADKYVISIEDVVKHFDNLNPLYIAHYQKKPDLGDDCINKLISTTKHASMVIKEVTNSISAGIYVSHGHNSIYGSDVHDWSSYVELAKDLPELRLPVESFEQFCLLLEKDTQTINTILDKKVPEEFEIMPFEDKTVIKLKVYNDINVFFGAKGTGKTKILEGIAKHYSDTGITAKVFESSADKLDDLFDLDGASFTINLNNYKINYCTNEIDSIKSACEKDVTRLSRYVQALTTQITNKNAQKFIVKDIGKISDQVQTRKFDSLEDVHKKLTEFNEFVVQNKAFREVVSENKLADLEKLLSEIIAEVLSEREDSFISSRGIKLFNNLISKIKSEIARKTATPMKPSTTGFKEYASNRINIERNIREIIGNMKKKIDNNSIYVGNLGDKGELYCVSEVTIQDGGVVDSDFNSVTQVGKKLQRSFSTKICEISNALYASNLFEKINELNELDKIEDLKTIHELLMLKRYFMLVDVPYKPSSGEASMILLHKELNEDKDIYILDEPEKSLGNDYISDVIVPLIKDKAKVGKKIFISTHDANIAVRTLPYNSIYRKHSKNGYDTYVGNPFSNFLINSANPEDKLDWKAVSMRTLEGGENAFGERGKIYGNL
ncbi:MAG: hypothetical protein Q8O13_10945 [Candidatus Omnitrophota bacterium]|nr:hypothetical protein [Candidatus Omnitrophota bacterium]